MLRAVFCQPFERALLLAWSILHGEPIQVPANLLRSARRLRLSNPTRRRLEAGWVMASYKAPKIKREQAIDRLRKKANRFADDPTAARWRYYVSAAWLVLLNARQPAADDNIVVMTPAKAEKIVIDMMRRAEEEPFARAAMLPLLHTAFPLSSPD